MSFETSLVRSGYILNKYYHLGTRGTC